MEIVLLLISFVIGVGIGSNLTLMLVRKALSKVINDNSNPHNMHVVPLPELTTERIAESIMLYDNSVFLCQGSSIEEVAAKFAKMKNVKIAQVKHDNTNIWFIDGEVVTGFDLA